MRKILSMDFDGVLHSYTAEWAGAAVIPDPPVEGSAEFLARALLSFDVQIYSSRSHQEGGIAAMGAWCRLHYGDMIADGLKFPAHKPAAHVTIDDRAFQFDGEWPEIEDLLAFRPWNKRSAAVETLPKVSHRQFMAYARKHHCSAYLYPRGLPRGGFIDACPTGPHDDSDLRVLAGP